LVFHVRYDGSTLDGGFRLSSRDDVDRLMDVLGLAGRMIEIMHPRPRAEDLSDVSQTEIVDG
jgi:hypothetical protein